MEGWRVVSIPTLLKATNSVLRTLACWAWGDVQSGTQGESELCGVVAATFEFFRDGFCGPRRVLSLSSPPVLFPARPGGPTLS